MTRPFPTPARGRVVVCALPGQCGFTAKPRCVRRLFAAVAVHTALFDLFERWRWCVWWRIVAQSRTRM